MSVDAAGNLGASVTSDRTTKLATGGRPVQGIVADGTAEVVLRIPTLNAGDIVSVAVLSDDCTNPNDPSTCTISLNSQSDGGLLNLSTGTNPTIPASSQADKSDGSQLAYLIYRAPDDFVRYSGGHPSDGTATSRPIYFRVSYFTSAGAPYATQYVPLTIVRPPTVLIHGWASDAIETWQHFTLNTNSIVYRVDYSSDITVTSTDPGVGPCVAGSLCVTTFKRSQLGVTFNTPSVAKQTILRMKDFASGNNAARAPVAISQVDVVAHSMGGLIARYWSTDLAHDTDGTPAPYRTPDNFNQGYIHKLVTIATPHYGTPIATEALSPRAGCFRLEAVYKDRLQINKAVLQGPGNITVGGAIGELDGDGIGLRLGDVIQTIKTSASRIPTHAIAGQITPTPNVAMAAIFATCGVIRSAATPVPITPLLPPDPIAIRMIPVPDAFSTLFDPNLTPATEYTTNTKAPNDGAVPLSSALLGRSCGDPGTKCFTNYAHGRNTARLVGLTSYLVDASGTVESRVNEVLGISVDDPYTWVKQ